MFRLPFIYPVLLVLLLAGCDRDRVASRYEVTGIDLSRYQGAVDWDTVATTGHAFAFMKATEGYEHRDLAFRANWTEAGRVGMRRGAYHYFLPHVSVERQLSNYIDLVKLAPGDLPPVLDVEARGRLTGAELVDHVRQWLVLAETHYGVKPILYTGLNFYNRHLAGQFDDYPLWLARYSRREPVTVCGRGFQFWQYTDRAEVKGIVGRVDRNVFGGSLAELQALLLPARQQDTIAAKK